MSPNISDIESDSSQMNHQLAEATMVNKAWINMETNPGCHELHCSFVSAETFNPRADSHMLRLHTPGHSGIIVKPSDLDDFLDCWNQLLAIHPNGTPETVEIRHQFERRWSEYTMGTVKTQKRAVLTAKGVTLTHEYADFVEFEPNVTVHFEEPDAIQQCLAVLGSRAKAKAGKDSKE